LLLDDYSEYLSFIESFALDYFDINSNLNQIMLLDLIENAIRSTRNNYIEDIWAELNQNKQATNKNSLKNS
jgi:hypothetical protein